MFMDDKGYYVGDYRSEPRPPPGKLICLESGVEFKHVFFFNERTGEWAAYIPCDGSGRDGNRYKMHPWIHGQCEVLSGCVKPGMIKFYPLDPEWDLSLAVEGKCQT